MRAGEAAPETPRPSLDDEALKSLAALAQVRDVYPNLRVPVEITYEQFTEVSAATGVQVIPSMPFMQAIGMEKEELVQALGVFFTVATVGLAFNLTRVGLLNAATAVPGAVAMAGSFAGMFIGQAVRSRMQPEAFRRWFLIAMILLGIYLTASALYSVSAA